MAPSASAPTAKPNINADTAAGAVAIEAARFFLLTDVPGVLDKEKKLIPEMTIDQVTALIADGTISGGMIPKVETCADAVKGGVGASVILDGKIPHVMLLEVFTQRGVGTLFKRN